MALGTPVVGDQGVFNNNVAVAATPPVGYAIGDLLVYVWFARSSSTPTSNPPSGWSVGPGFASANSSIFTYWKIAASTSETMPSITKATVTNLTLGVVCFAISGAHATTPFDVSPVAMDSGTDAAGNSSGPISAVTTATNGATVFYVQARNNNWTAAGASTPAGYTELWDGSSTSGDDGGFSGGYKAMPTAGSSGTATVAITGGVAADLWSGFQFAIKPATAGATAPPTVVQGSTTIPTPTVSASKTVSPTVVSGTTAIPSVSVSTGAGAAPTLVQFIQNRSAGGAASVSVTLATAPAAGNLLVLGCALDKTSVSATVSAPAGFTEVYDISGTSVSFSAAYKVATGSESVITVTRDTGTSAGGDSLWVGEYTRGGVSGSEWSLVTSLSVPSDNLTTFTPATGTTGSLASSGIAVALMGVDTCRSVFLGTTFSWSNSYTSQATLVDSSGAAGIFVADKAVTAGTTTGTTYTYSGGTSVADQWTTALLVFAPASAGGATVTPTVVQGSTTIPSVSVSGSVSRTVTPTVVQGSTTIPLVSVSTGTPSSFTMAWVSDFQLTSSWGSAQSDAMSRVTTLGADYLLVGGDVADGGTSAQYTLFGNNMSAWKSKIIATPGNHDYSLGNANDWYAYFGSGTMGQGASAAAPWFSLDIQGWHVISVTAASGSPGTGQPSYLNPSTQYTWLAADLAANTGKPILAILHEARYSDDTTHGDETNATAIVNLLHAYNADIIVSGHVHVVQRFPAADGSGNLDAAGPVEFTSTGIRTRGTIGTGSVLTPDYSSGTEIAILHFTLRASAYDWKFVRVSDGTVLDSGTKNTYSGQTSSSTVTPTVVQGTTAVPTITISGSVSRTVTPTVVQGTTAVPTITVTTGPATSAVTKTFTFRHSVKAKVTKALTFRHNVASPTGGSYTGATYRNPVIFRSSRVYRSSNTTLVTKTLTFRHNVLANGAVQKTFTFRNNVRSTVAKAFTFRHNVAGPSVGALLATKTLQFKYNVNVPYTAAPTSDTLSFIELRLYVGGSTIVLPYFRSLSADSRYNDAAAIDFEYPTDLAVAAGLGEQSEVGVIVGFTQSDPVEIERYTIEQSDSVNATDGVKATRYSGRSMVARLEDAIVYPQNWPVTSPPGHEFINATPGTIIRTLVAKAQALGYITDLDVTSFTGTATTNSQGWTKSVTAQFSNGQSLLSVLTDLAARGICDFKMSGKALQLYNEGSLATHRSVTARVGQNTAEQETRSESREFASAVLIEGEAGTMTEVVDATAVAAVRKKARYVQQGGVSDAATLQLLGQAELDSYKTFKREETVGLALISDAAQPFKDFKAGEWIQLDKGTGAATEVRVLQVSVGVDESRKITAGVALNSLIEESSIKLQRKIDAIMGGSGGIWGALPVPENPEALMTPSAPGVAQAMSLFYRDSEGRGYSQATVNWSAVTTATNGAAISPAKYEIEYATGSQFSYSTPLTPSPAVEDPSLTTLFDRRSLGLTWVGGVAGQSLRTNSGFDLWSFGDSIYGTLDGSGAVTGTYFSPRNVLAKVSTPAMSFIPLCGQPNLLDANTATLETTVGKWAASGTNCTTARSTVQKRIGTAGLLITASSAADATAFTSSGAVNSWAVTVGQTYTAFGSVKGVSAAKDFLIGIRWFDTNGNVLSTSYSSQMTGSSSVYVRGTVVAAAPANATHAGLAVQVKSMASSGTVAADQFCLVAGDQRHQSFASPTRTTAYASLIQPEEVGLATTGWLTARDMTLQGYVYLWSTSYGATGQTGTTVLTQHDPATMEFKDSVAWLTDDSVAWGTAVLEDGSYVYVYGVTVDSRTYCMRVPVANVWSGTKEYWTGATWSTTRSSAAAVFSQSITSVSLIGSTYFGLYISGSQIKQATASAPQGAWSASSTVYTMPDVSASMWGVQPTFHPELDTVSAGVSMSYSVNGTDVATHMDRFRPRGIRGPAGEITLADPSEWVAASSTTNTVTYLSGLPVGRTFRARVKAVSSYSVPSAWTLTPTILLATDATAPPTPSRPMVSDALRSVRVGWDGLGAFGERMPLDFKHVEIHLWTSQDFTPSQVTFKGTLTGTGSWVATDLVYGTTYFVKLVAVDFDGNRSEASAVGSATPAQLSDPDLPDKLITGAKIAEGAINTTHLTVSTLEGNAAMNGAFETLEPSDLTKPQAWVKSGWPVGSAVTWGLESTSPLQGTYSLTTTTPSGQTAYIMQSQAALIPVAQLGLYYVTVKVKSSRELLTKNNILGVRLLNSVADIDVADGTSTVEWVSLAAVPITNKFGDYVEGEVAVKYGVLEGQIYIDSSRSARKYLAVYLQTEDPADGLPVTTVWDDVAVRRVVGSAEIADASILNAKIANAAIDDAKISSVTAGKITTGTLAADLTVSGSIKTSDSAPNVEIDSLGIRAHDLDSVEVSTISAATGQATFSGLSIYGNSSANFSVDHASDPNAYIGGKGEASFVSVSAGSITLGDVPLADTLDAMPKGLVAYFNIADAGGISGDYAKTTSEKPLWYLSFLCKAGRLYKISSNNIRLRSTNASDDVGLNVRYTSGAVEADVVAPTTTSGLMTTARVTGVKSLTAGGDSVNISRMFPTDVSSDTYFRFLVSLQRIAGSGTAEIVAAERVQIWIEDMGVAPAASTGNLDYSSWVARPARSTWWQNYEGGGWVANSLAGYDKVLQGEMRLGNGLSESMIGFDGSTIASWLSGATVTKIELGLTNILAPVPNRNDPFGLYGDGVSVVIGTHSRTVKPGATYVPAPAKDIVFDTDGSHYVWKRGQSRRVLIASDTVRTDIKDAFVRGTASGIWIGKRTDPVDAGDQWKGSFRPSDADVSMRPTLYFTYTKDR